MEKTADEWETVESYIKLGKVIAGLSVVNDPAERTIKLGTTYTGIITKKEATRQDLIQGVELTRHAFAYPTRQCVFSDGKLSATVDELLDMQT